jgi:hypothetical protein
MSTSRIVVTLFAGCIALGAVSPAHAIFDSFAKPRDVVGEATDLPQPPPSPKLTTPPSHQTSTPIVRNFTITRKLEVQQGPAKLRAK